MKQKILIITTLINLFCLTLVAQETNNVQFENKISNLETRLKSQNKISVQLTAQIKNQQAKIQELEQEKNELAKQLKEDINAFSAKIENLENENKKNTEIQELKLNELKSTLNSKNFNLYLYIALALVFALILFVYFMKMATNKAISQQKANWSDFMNFIVKR
jgi:DNA repair exonuclease SbcCD ATPase subunit